MTTQRIPLTPTCQEKWPDLEKLTLVSSGGKSPTILLKLIDVWQLRTRSHHKRVPGREGQQISMTWGRLWPQPHRAHREMGYGPRTAAKAQSLLRTWVHSAHKACERYWELPTMTTLDSFVLSLMSKFLPGLWVQSSFWIHYGQCQTELSGSVSPPRCVRQKKGDSLMGDCRPPDISFLFVYLFMEVGRTHISWNIS